MGIDLNGEAVKKMTISKLLGMGFAFSRAKIKHSVLRSPFI
ncbi:hypothetical protein P799_18695 [Lysinibacillus sphaericus CBAM5]|nr:hypothetical protein P799_18695 [Lysinibacillus sphaericus CBAM5]